MPFQLARYAEVDEILTTRDPLYDLTSLINFLTASDYVIELLMSRHGVSAADAKDRARKALPHARAALAFLEETFSSRSETAFLPGYYAALNLIKVCILFGKYHRELKTNRWHGAQYDVTAKDSHNLLTEKITLHKQGAVSLFYKTLTDHEIRKKRDIKLDSIYSLLFDIQAEYAMATGRSFRVWLFAFDFEENGPNMRPRARVRYPHNFKGIPLKSLRLFRNFRVEVANDLVGSWVPNQTDRAEAVRNQIRPFLMYDPTGIREERLVPTPVHFSTILMPEELPIVLALFHLCSVVRYKPEFFAKVRDSRYWPVVVAVRQHCFYKLLTLFWSFVQQKAVNFQRVS